jgi:hypothetical protein
MLLDIQYRLHGKGRIQFKTSLLRCCEARTLACNSADPAAAGHSSGCSASSAMLRPQKHLKHKFCYSRMTKMQTRVFDRDRGASKCHRRKSGACVAELQAPVDINITSDTANRVQHRCTSLAMIKCAVTTMSSPLAQHGHHHVGSSRPTPFLTLAHSTIKIVASRPCSLNPVSTRRCAGSCSTMFLWV